MTIFAIIKKNVTQTKLPYDSEYTFFKRTILALCLCIMTFSANSEESFNTNIPLTFEAQSLNPVFYHSDQKLVDFTYSALLLLGDASGRNIGEDGSPANVLFFIKENAIKNEKLNLDIFPEVTSEDKSFLRKIRFMGNECSIQILNSELAILVLDPVKIANEEHAKICVIYGFSILLSADLPRPTAKSKWEIILANMLEKITKSEVN